MAFWYQTGVPTFAARAPGAEARHLPNLDRVIVPARDLAGAGRYGKGDVLAEPEGSGGDGRGMLLFRPPGQAGAWIELPFDVGTKEPLRLAVSGSGLPEGGRYQAYLDGVKVGRPMDFYSGDRAAREFPLLDFWPDSGAYVLRLECIGQDANSTGHALAIEAIRLRERRPRVARYGHDKDKDWRKAPILYD